MPTKLTRQNLAKCPDCADGLTSYISQSGMAQGTRTYGPCPTCSGTMVAPTAAERARRMAASARQAITTSYRGPTGSNGSRVIARCEAKRISVPWDHALDASANHAAAALELMDQLGWSERNDLVMGGTREGYVFVQVPRRS